VQKGVVKAGTEGNFTVTLDPGNGSAPDLTLSAQFSADRSLPDAWTTCFATYQDFLAFCVPQDRALSSQPCYQRVTRQEIDLDIPLEACQPLQASVVSKAAQALVGEATPVCFYVPALVLRFNREEHDRKPDSVSA
jgi:hypothetical protein